MKKIRVSLVLVTLLSGIFFLYNAPQNKIQAAPPSGYSDILTAQGINVVSGANSATSEIDGDYGSMFKLTQFTSYEPFGEAETIEYASHESKAYRFHKSTSAAEKGVWVRNVGMYNGRSVDLKLIIDDMDFADKGGGNIPYFNFLAVDFSDINSTSDLIIPNTSTWGEAFLFLGSTTRSASKINDTYTFEDNAHYHYEFYDNETKAQLNYKGTWNFNNINIAKAVTTPFNNDFSKMFVLDSTWIGYKDSNKPNYLELFGSGTTVNSPASRLTQLFESQSFATSLEKRYSNGSGGTTIGAMGIMYSTESLARIAPAKPIIFAEKNSAVHTEADYGRIRYSILQTVADNKLENRNTTFSIETTVPSQYDIDLSKIKIYEYGTGDTVDKTGLFSIALDPANSSRVILTVKDPASNEFNGSVLDIKIEAKPNITFKFNKDTHNYQMGGKDDAYLIYELGGTTTTTHYTYLNRFSGDLNAEIITTDDQTKAKVLYEGLPDADSKQNIKVPLGTNFTADYQDPGTTFLDNIRVDTDNPLDKPVKVSYKQPLPETSAVGDVVLTLTLTTAKNVTKDMQVNVKIVPTSAELRVKYKINGNYLTNKYPDYVDSTQMIGDPINLKNIKQVTDTIEAIKNAGYEQTNNPVEEFELSASGNTVEYEFEGRLFLSSTPTILNFGIEEVGYKAIRVNEAVLDKDLIVTDTRASKQKWSLQAKVTQEFTLTDIDGSKKVIPNILRYNDGSDTEKSFILNNAQELLADTHTASEEFNVSSTWKPDGKGFKLDVSGDAVKKLGKYQAKIEFTVGETP